MSEEVARRAGYRCEYCGCPADHCPDDYHVEHIQPRSKVGSDALANLAWSGQGCKNRKFTATEAQGPGSGELVRLFHPRRDGWAEHFRWSEDGRRMFGLTPVGRATISRLDLNREGVVNLCAVLQLAGKHPPVRDAD